MLLIFCFWISRVRNRNGLYFVGCISLVARRRLPRLIFRALMVVRFDGPFCTVLNVSKDVQVLLYSVRYVFLLSRPLFCGGSPFHIVIKTVKNVMRLLPLRCYIAECICTLKMIKQIIVWQTADDMHLTYINMQKKCCACTSTLGSLSLSLI